MFLTDNELTLGDFLNMAGFVPPTQGYKLNNLPVNIDTEETYPDSDTVEYSRKDPATKIQQMDTPAEYAIIERNPVVNSGPKAPVIPQTTPIESLECPFIQEVQDVAAGKNGESLIFNNIINME